MSFIKKNSFAAIVFVFTCLAIAIIYIKDEKIEKYEQIQVQSGQTLESLADHYRGKMAKEDWIHFVVHENTVYGGVIEAGQTLQVPVEKRSVYIAQLDQQNELEDAEIIKVASGR